MIRVPTFVSSIRVSCSRRFRRARGSGRFRFGGGGQLPLPRRHPRSPFSNRARASLVGSSSWRRRSRRRRPRAHKVRRSSTIRDVRSGFTRSSTEIRPRIFAFSVTGDSRCSPGGRDRVTPASATGRDWTTCTTARIARSRRCTPATASTPIRTNSTSRRRTPRSSRRTIWCSPRSLQRRHGPADGSVFDGVVQELDIATGHVLFEWRSLDHVALEESQVAPPTTSDTAYDYFHINSINLDNDGNLIVSARITWTAY